MTPLRRNLPLFAPRVSSRAVGRTRPIPNRPRVARSRYGSTFQTILAERNLPNGVFENDAKPRLNEERGRLGSTCLSAVGIAGSLSESGSVDREIVDRAQFPRGRAGDVVFTRNPAVSLGTRSGNAALHQKKRRPHRCGVQNPLKAFAAAHARARLVRGL